MGKMSRTKGHGYERQVAQFFRVIFPGACRQLEYQEGLGVDLMNTGNLRVQCKRGKDYAPINKLDEARGPTGIPVLVTQADRKESLVALRLVDFLEILRNPIYALGANPNVLVPLEASPDEPNAIYPADDAC